MPGGPEGGGYQPSEGEIKDAESNMSEKEAILSEARDDAHKYYEHQEKNRPLNIQWVGIAPREDISQATEQAVQEYQKDHEEPIKSIIVIASKPTGGSFLQQTYRHMRIRAKINEADYYLGVVDLRKGEKNFKPQVFKGRLYDGKGRIYEENSSPEAAEDKLD